MTSVAPFGAWRSPLSAERVAAASLGLGCLAVDGDAIWIKIALGDIVDEAVNDCRQLVKPPVEPRDFAVKRCARDDAPAGPARC